jgi:ketosteroid isomerase-like protein
MKRTCLALTVLAAGMSPAAFAQTMSPAEQDVVKYRQAMSNQFAAGIKTKDTAWVTDHFTPDAVYVFLVPSRRVTVGRDAIKKQYEGAYQSGAVTEYVGKVLEAHVRPDGTAWTLGSWALTSVAKDGSTRQTEGNWVDELKREGDQWLVTFEAIGGQPAAPK